MPMWLVNAAVTHLRNLLPLAAVTLGEERLQGVGQDVGVGSACVRVHRRLVRSTRLAALAAVIAWV